MVFRKIVPAIKPEDRVRCHLDPPDEEDYSTYYKYEDYRISDSLWEALFPGIKNFPDRPLDEQMVSVTFYFGRVIWLVFCLGVVGYLIVWIVFALLRWIVLF